MGKLVDWARSTSPWILHLNCGSCNGCDIETLDSLMPRYDLERFGVQQKDTPRHADILVCTGPVTRQMEPRLERIYEQMPEPKLVVAAGSCAASGGVFQDCYNCHDGIDEVIPVDMYVPGCPISPEALIDGIIRLLEGADEDRKATELRERSEEVFDESLDEAKSTAGGAESTQERTESTQERTESTQERAESTLEVIDDEHVVADT